MGISYSSYVNNYRVNIGTPTASMNSAVAYIGKALNPNPLANINKNTLVKTTYRRAITNCSFIGNNLNSVSPSTIGANGNKFSFNRITIRRAYQNYAVITISNIPTPQSAPVMKVKGINVIGPAKVNTISIANNNNYYYGMCKSSMMITNMFMNRSLVNVVTMAKNNNVYAPQQQQIYVGTSYDDKITQIDPTQVTFPPDIRQDGFNDIGITIVSGKYCEIKLNSTDGISIVSIDTLPACLIYDRTKTAITGVPLTTGKQVSKVTLSNGTVATLTFNIIPLSISVGI